MRSLWLDNRIQNLSLMTGVDRSYNVGVDLNNFTPISLITLTEIMGSRPPPKTRPS